MVSKYVILTCAALVAVAVVPDTSGFKKAKYDECELNCYMDGNKRVCPTMPECELRADPN